MYFLQNYQQVSLFADAAIDDARQLGDGYDFQLTLGSVYWLAEVKGLRTRTGAIRLTQNEFDKATEFRERFRATDNVIEIFLLPETSAPRYHFVDFVRRKRLPGLQNAR